MSGEWQVLISARGTRSNCGMSVPVTEWEFWDTENVWGSPNHARYLCTGPTLVELLLNDSFLKDLQLFCSLGCHTGEGQVTGGISLVL